MNSRHLLLFLNFVQICTSAIRKLSDEEYELMPPLVSLDPFESCISRPGGRYCMAHAVFVADQPSLLLQQIQEYSANVLFHFNHTRALYGTCVSQNCKVFYNNTTEDVLVGSALEACLNQTVWKQYNLKVKLDGDVTCHEYNEKKSKIETGDIAVASIVIALILCNIIGSVFYICCSKKDGMVAQFLLCFSIPRNWERLTAPQGDNDPRLDGLEGVNGIRAVMMILVVASHASLPAFIICENPKFLERILETYPAHMILSGMMFVQTFVFLSAFLLVYLSLLKTERHHVTWRMIPFYLLKRWLRVTMPYAVMLAVSLRVVKHISPSPRWNLLLGTQEVDCSRNWWKHFLYINNYDDQSRCMLYTWYVAADMQLFCLGVIIFVFCQSQFSRKVVLSLLFVVGLAIPALQTYFQDLNGVYLITPSMITNFFIFDRSFNELHRRGHTHIASYAVGMACGYLFYYMQRNDFNASKYRRWRFLYWMLVPAAVSLTLFGSVLYEEGPRVSLYYRMFIAAFIKPAFALLVGLLVIGMAFKLETACRGFLEWRGWRGAARVSYAAYLLHWAALGAAVGSRAAPPPPTSYLGLSELVVFNLVTTFIAAYLFYITVEAPLAQLTSICLQKLSSGKWRKYSLEDTNEDNKSKSKKNI